jgi:hypothetical protein
MAFLSDAQKAAIIATIATDETTADLWRNPAESGGRTTARVWIPAPISPFASARLGRTIAI